MVWNGLTNIFFEAANFNSYDGGHYQIEPIHWFAL